LSFKQTKNLNILRVMLKNVKVKYLIFINMIKSLYQIQIELNTKLLYQMILLIFEKKETKNPASSPA